MGFLFASIKWGIWKHKLPQIYPDKTPNCTTGYIITKIIIYYKNTNDILYDGKDGSI
jgi:hypothetical protein